MKLKVLAEAGPTIGLGHFTRSLALVQMVRNLVDPVFFGRDDKLLAASLEQHDIRFQRISNFDDFLKGVSKDDIILLDSYEYDNSFEKAVYEKSHSLIIIDDKHDRSYSADYIINHAPGVSASDYQVQNDCTLLLGPAYALLRPAFLRTEVKTVNTHPAKAVVCFGGADPNNLSYSVVELLLSFPQIREVHLIIGPAYTFYSSLELLMNDNRLKISRGLPEEDMAEALKHGDFAIVPSSGILLECLGVGTPPISGYYVDNQSLMYEGWLNESAIIGVEKFDMDLLKEKLSQILNGQIDLTKLIGNNPVDGKSPERFQKVFKEIISSYGS